MGFKATGELHVIEETKQISQRFQKREFVVKLDDGSRFPQFVLFQLTGNRCDALEGFRVGEQIELEFSLRGREWQSPKGETKYFNSLDVWTIERVGAEPRGGGGGGDDEPPLPDEPPPDLADEIPF